ncbi:MAG: SufD family Fe-S cluster assembly protein [Nitrososphaerales archaeon]
MRVQCDALLLDEHSRSDTYQTVDVANQTADVGHEASVSKISRGLGQAQARA